MIDVLPDEASLAMILTHELAHIVLGHQLNTKLAFNDRLFFPDERTFERMDFARDKTEEEAADKKALELLNNSPYKDKLANAGLFLKAVQARAPQLRNLIRAHLGDSLLNGDATRMSSLMTSSPQFDPKKLDQIAALPLGGRVKVDPWTDQLELIKTKPVSITAATEKMPFEVTPFFPFLTRFGAPPPVPEKSAPAAAPAACTGAGKNGCRTLSVEPIGKLADRQNQRHLCLDDCARNTPLRAIHIKSVAKLGGQGRAVQWAQLPDSLKSVFAH